MKIEQGKATTRPYFTVSVHKDELVVASGKTLPYPAWIGTIGGDGKITVWHPVGYRPRGYKVAAWAMLEKARQQLIDEGKVRA